VIFNWDDVDIAWILSGSATGFDVLIAVIILTFIKIEFTTKAEYVSYHHIAAVSPAWSA
jgi:hypothetical protein